MRRDKNDQKWQDCKRKVLEMDNNKCLLCECLTIPEAIRFQKSNPEFSTYTIDPAHHIAVSRSIKSMYDPNNVFSICRCHHERLDHSKNPITGKPCNSEETEYWWKRIIKKREENLKGKSIKYFEFYYDQI